MNSHRSRARLVHAVAALAMLLLAAPPARGQRPAVPGSISGIVVDSETMRPLTSVRLILQPSPAGILLERGDNPVPFGKEARVVITDSAGLYRLGTLQAGNYRLHARALGYRPMTVDLRISESHDSQLSVGMLVQPIHLEPVVARTAAVHPDRSFAGTRAADPEDTRRVLAERARQDRFLTGDTRSITSADVQEALTLGEADLFRALQRVPGVETRDDYTAELWVRGASWDQTAVFFDGVPLFNPLHGAGLFSAVNTDAVGAAFLHAGVQPTELRSGGAAVVALRSRAGGAPGRRGAAELSLVSGRIVADGRTRGGRVGWMVAGRRTYADLLPAGVSTAIGAGVDRIPYSFRDVAGRVDAHLGRGARIEASGIHEADRLSGDIGGLVTATDGRWGSNAGQLSLHHTLGAGTLRHSVGGSRFAARADAREPIPTISHCSSCPGSYHPTHGPFRGQPLDNSVAYAFASGTWESTHPSDSARWAAGYRAVRQEARYGTTGLWPYRSAGPEETSADRGLAYLVLWGERAWHPLPAVALESGGRAEVGGRIAGAGPVRLAPHLALRYRAGAGTSLSAGVARSFQYAQAIVPAGPGYHPVATSHLFWTLADEDTPLLRADVASLGIEQWIGGATLLSAATYLRHTSGVATPDPTPGWMTDRPLFVAARGEARGVDLSVRRLVGRWTGGVSYAYNNAETEAQGYRYAAPTSRRHALDLTSAVRVTRALRVGGAYKVASGAAFTRYESALRECAMPDDPASCRYLTYAREAGAERAPTYRSADLLLDWSGTVGGWQVGAFAQLHNVLGDRNRAAYQSSRTVCRTAAGARCADPILDPLPESFDAENNLYLPGLPRVPTVGLRVVF